MMHRLAAPLFAALLVVAAPAAARTPTLAEVESALAATTSMRADFVQTGGDGRVARGRMLLKRPGRVRFDYGDRGRQLVVADGRNLIFIDYQVAQVSQWPIRSTALGVLLDPGADLSRVARVLPAEQSPQPGQVAVEAADPKRPEAGRILFFLAADPAAPGGWRLTGWRVTDAQGNLTTVQLERVQMNVPVADSAFAFRDPRRRPGAPGRG